MKINYISLQISGLVWFLLQLTELEGFTKLKQLFNIQTYTHFKIPNQYTGKVTLTAQCCTNSCWRCALGVFQHTHGNYQRRVNFLSYLDGKMMELHSNDVDLEDGEVTNRHQSNP